MNLNFGIKVLLWGVLLTPVVFWPDFYFPFIISKTIWFRVLLGLAVILAGYLLFTGGKIPKVRLSWPVWALLGFVVVALVAAVFGLDFYRSFWGSFERMEGVITYISLFVYLWLILFFWRKDDDWLIALRIVSLAGLITALYGIAQAYSLLPVFGAGIGRVGGTIGNAAFFAGWLILAGGVSLYHYFKESNFYWRSVALASFVFILPTILLTETRGAILGVVVGAFLFALLAALSGKLLNFKIKRAAIAFLALLVVLTAGFFGFKDSLAESNINWLSRIALISYEDATVNNRLLVWDTAWQGFKENPILGVGTDNLNIVFNKKYHPGITEDWFDRAHNTYLDQLVQHGILGLTLLVIWLAFLVWAPYKLRKEDKYLWLIITPMMAAYAIHLFFVFDVLSTYLILIFLTGYLAFRIYGNGENEYEIGDKWRMGLGGFLAIMAIGFIYMAVISPLIINTSITKGYRGVITDNESAINYWQSALQARFALNEAVLQAYDAFGVMVSSRGRYPDALTEENMGRFRDLVQSGFERAIDYYPQDVRLYLHYAQFIQQHRQDLGGRLPELLDRAIELSPRRAPAVYLRVQYLAGLGEFEEALEALDELAERLPEFGQVGLYKAKIASLAGDLELAEAAIDKAEEIGFDFTPLNLRLVLEYLLNTEQYERTLPYYEELIKRLPDNYEYRVDRSKVYFILGEVDKAVEEIGFIREVEPEALVEFEDYVEFLRGEGVF